MYLIVAFLVTALFAIFLIPFFNPKGKGIVVILSVILQGVICGCIVFKALQGNTSEYMLAGSYSVPDISIRIDALSAWFILIINFTVIMGAIYGSQYMFAYRDQPSQLTLHWVSYILMHTSLIGICVLQNSLAFLISWEIMALSTFLLVIFEHGKREVLKAGINYLIQAHISILFLMLGFMWVAIRINTFDFKGITQFTSTLPVEISLVLFFCFFIGFAIKAGFVPFHTWLPHAHPASPAHVSGVMSGVIIKIGIYGILRMVLLVRSDYISIGYAILILSVLSGLYGVMLAIIQHNLKKLLAYHSIENIGIIGIGIGMGCIGLGSGNQLLIVLGFAGALLHTLNHSLFKSLLFFASGNIYQLLHTVDIEKFGGLVKKLPYTAFVFLIASLAICGLPPFNGFISEFLLYNGLFFGLRETDTSSLTILIFSVFGLALIGGLALFCFTKAFGTVFLGIPRQHQPVLQKEKIDVKMFPLFIIIIPILLIGLFPQYVIQLLKEPVKLFSKYPGSYLSYMEFPYTGILSSVSQLCLGFLVLVFIILLVRKKVMSHYLVQKKPTWNCAYATPNSKLQYTAGSFVRSYRKLAEPLLFVHKTKTDIYGIFPVKGGDHATRPDDKIEIWLIKFPVKQLKYMFNRFTFLQNGNPQLYILYGVSFIILLISIPPVFEVLKYWIKFLNNL